MARCRHAGRSRARDSGTPRTIQAPGWRLRSRASGSQTPATPAFRSASKQRFAAFNLKKLPCPKELLLSQAPQGIGQAYVRRLASNGFDIAVADVAEATDARAIVEAAGRKFFTAVVDVTSPEATRQTVGGYGSHRRRTTHTFAIDSSGIQSVGEILRDKEALPRRHHIRQYESDGR